MRSSGPPETLAARVRELAAELDAERQRTGIDTALPPATEEAERFLSEPQSGFHMTAYGNKIGEQLWRLWSLPDATTAPRYEDFQAPALDEDGDGLPFD